MFQITNDVIYLTRGDYAKIKCDLKSGETSEDYVMGPGDFLTLTIRESPSKESPVLCMINSFTDEITIQNEDTADIPVGAYSADIQLTTYDGKRFTFWPTLEGYSDKNRAKEKNFKNFILQPEVTRE